MATLEMTVRSYLTLQEKDPDHELLRLAEIHPDGGGITPNMEWVDRCVIDADCWVENGVEYYKSHNAYARYHFAMQAALRGEPYSLPPEEDS